MSEIKTNTLASENEKNFREVMQEVYRENPIPDNEVLQNLGLFINRQTLSRMLWFDFLYKKFVNVHGIIMEFGVRWGRDLALFESLRGIYEPYNYLRKIVGFDTFSGFPSVHDKDGDSAVIQEGSYSVTDSYEKYLESIMNYHELESPLSHIKKYQLVKGDATLSLENYLEENPETIVAFAYFDLDIYEPTKRCLELLKDHLVKGSIIGFDELNSHWFPGETFAFKEVFGLSNYKIMNFPPNPGPSYIVFE